MRLPKLIGANLIGERQKKRILMSLLHKFAPLLTTVLVSFGALAQQNSHPEILLWPNGAPGSQNKTGAEKVRVTDGGDHVISNIHHPSITAYLPDSKALRVAIIIAPGGGHTELWIDHEGYNVAKWLSEQGIAAFVLKYRLAKEPNSTYTVEGDELADIERAIRLVKSRAKEWHIDSSRIGVMGFSAGGELAGLAAMHFGDPHPSSDPIDQFNCRPAFQALIYPGGAAKLLPVPSSPPLFVLGGYQDRNDISEGIAQLYLRYKQAGVPAELHIYSSAGHGFGMRASTTEAAIAGWTHRFTEWLHEIKMRP